MVKLTKKKKNQIATVLRNLALTLTALAFFLTGLMITVNNALGSYWRNVWCEQCGVESKARIILVLLILSVALLIVAEPFQENKANKKEL